MFVIQTATRTAPVFLLRRPFPDNLSKRHDVTSEPRVPAGQPHGGEWTALKPGDPHPLGYEPSTKEQRDQVKQMTGKAVPPASWGLKVHADPNSRYAATWYDSKGKRQQLYSQHGEEERSAHKFGRLEHFTHVLPQLRNAVKKDLQRNDADPQRVAAAVVALVDKTAMRIGSEEYAREHETYGASSLRKQHVSIKGNRIQFHFRGKHAKEHDRTVQDALLAEVIRHMMDLPGDRLFQARGAKGDLLPMTEQRVRDYLKPLGINPKEFRTYHATKRATEILLSMPEAKTEKERQKNVTACIKAVSEELGNTPAVCRAAYVNPEVIEAYLKGGLKGVVK